LDPGTGNEAANINASSIILTISVKSLVTSPRVVIAGDPNRNPFGTNALLSLGMVFLLVAI
jgi:hypothetical protein